MIAERIQPCCISALEDTGTVSLLDDSWLKICTQQRALGNRMAGVGGSHVFVDFYHAFELERMSDQCNPAFRTRAVTQNPSMSTMLG